MSSVPVAKYRLSTTSERPHPPSLTEFNTIKKNIILVLKVAYILFIGTDKMDIDGLF